MTENASSKANKVSNRMKLGNNGAQPKGFRQMPHKTAPNHVELDPIAWKLIESLQHNARLSFAELGRKVGLSTPAVAERIHRLEDAGIITGYHASVNLAKLGVPIRVLVRLTIPGG